MDIQNYEPIFSIVHCSDHKSQLHGYPSKETANEEVAAIESASCGIFK